MHNVLVIDDDYQVVEFLSFLLQKRFHCKVQSAENGLTALSMLKEENPDLIFVDIAMPVLDGIETIQAIRGEDKFKNTPIVILSANKDRDIIQKATKLNIIDYILKPVTYNSVYNRLQNIFNNLSSNGSSEEEAETPKRTTVVVVEKDNECRDLLNQKLGSHYNVLLEDNGMDGLKRILNYVPTVVFIGEDLPLLNERMLAQKIRDMSKLNNTRLVYYASYGAMVENDKILFDLIVPKSRKDQDLPEIIRKLIRYKKFPEN